jgi:hypothetical protein
MILSVASGLRVRCIWLSAFYNLSPNVTEVAYIIQVEFEDKDDTQKALILLQCIASLVGEGEGLPLGSPGPQYGAFVDPDKSMPIVRLSHRRWTEEMASAAQSIISAIANRHGWPIRRLFI